jgi:putative peptidoglycan lipid II flippase
LRRRGLLRVSKGWGGFLLRVAAACLAMGAWMVWIDGHLDWIAMAAHKGQRAAWMAASLGVSALIYFGVLRLLGLDLRRFRNPV